MHPHEYRHRRKAASRSDLVIAPSAVHGHDEVAAPRPPPIGAAEVPRSRKLIKWPVVHEMTGKSRTQAWRDIKADRFPAPVQTGPNSVAWYLDEIEAYVASRPRVNYAPAPEQPEAA